MCRTASGRGGRVARGRAFHVASARFEAARDRLEAVVARLERAAALAGERVVANGSAAAPAIVDTAEQERLSAALSTLRGDYEQLQLAARDVSTRLDQAIERVEVLVNGGQH